MIKSRIAAFLLLCLFVADIPGLKAQNAEAEPLRVMTFNIRYPNPDDGFNFWPRRKQLVASMIRFHEADLVGVQEAFRSQLDELMDMLPGYAWVGVCRTDGTQEPEPDNEFSAILYREARIEVLRDQTFWLSENPGEAGVAGWDAALPRIVTWAEVKDKVNGNSFFHFNTHFDHRGQEARANSAKLILQQIKDIAGEVPTLITGDFNAIPESVPYRTLVDEQDPEHLTDAIMVTEQPHHGPRLTSTNGFLFPGASGRIDYIFIKNGVKVRKHAILAESWSGRLPSDHLPVLAEVVIE